MCKCTEWIMLYKVQNRGMFTIHLLSLIKAPHVRAPLIVKILISSQWAEVNAGIILYRAKNNSRGKNSCFDFGKLKTWVIKEQEGQSYTSTWCYSSTHTPHDPLLRAWHDFSCSTSFLLQCILEHGRLHIQRLTVQSGNRNGIIL